MDTDQGLINCWEVGRNTASIKPELAAAAAKGELPELPFEGGIAGNPESPNKYGHLYYYAMWLGLRNESLQIDPDGEHEVTCSRTGLKKVFTMNLLKIEPINVFFTGFGKETETLIKNAKKYGYKVSDKVTKTLYYLVCGPSPDAPTVKKAKDNGAEIISADEWKKKLAEKQGSKKHHTSEQNKQLKF